MGAWGKEGHCLRLLQVPMQLQGSGRWQLNGAAAVAGVQRSFPVAAGVQTLKRAPSKQLHAWRSHQCRLYPMP